MLDAQHAPQDHGDLFELWRLSRFLPALWGYHARDAHGGMTGVETSCEFLNLLWLVASGFDDRRLRDESRHESPAAQMWCEGYVPRQSYRRCAEASAKPIKR